MVICSIPKAGRWTIGGKARGLYKLQKAGISVPDFIVIPAETFAPLLQSLPTDEEGILLRKQCLLAFVLSDKDKQSLQATLDSWHFPANPVVVRSSIADEDGEKDAFPGMMDSFLNLKSLDEVYAAISRCAASAYSERAIAYRKQKQLSMDALPAVIIQLQVQAQASGVLFTTFPEYPQEMAVHALWGFGEGLVSGLLEADEFYLLKKTGILHRQKITNKELQLVALESGGLQQLEVEKEKQQLPALSQEQLQALFTIGKQLEQAFARPQDIEFVIAAGKAQVVQSRPITQPIPEVVVYDNSNIQESYCGVTTPLTFSFATRAYATVYRQTMHVLGLSLQTINAQEKTITNLLGLVKGRIYYNINNWYRGLQLLPSFKQNKEDMERMMGLEEPVDFVESKEKTLLQKVKMIPRLLVNLSKLLWAFLQLSKKVTGFHAQFQAFYLQFYQQPLDTLGVMDLLKKKTLLDQTLLSNWTTPIINDFYVMMNNGKVVRKLQKAGITDTNEFLSRYLSGDKQIESTQPTLAMQRLAITAHTQKELRALLLSLPPDIHQQVQKAFPAFYLAVQDFIEQYGDRTVGELKLETLTMRIEPYVFYKYLRNFLADACSPPALAESSTHLHQGATQELETLLKVHTPLFRKSVWTSLQKLQEAIRYRESLRLERTRLFGMYRSLYLQMGKLLVQEGKLLAARDAFYLTEEEIALLLLDQPSCDFKALVEQRKKEFEAYKKEEVPSRVVVPSPPLMQQKQEPMKPGSLQGTGCFHGEAIGEVIVIKDPGDDLDVHGKIVCALRTDPGWAALFPTCRGVIIEKGSSLSHSVILLRELRIPTIINVPGLTNALQSGQWVKMSGSNGEITILEHEKIRAHTL